MNKKKILILIPHYLPGYKIGGPLSSISNMIEILGDEYDFMVLTSDRDMGSQNPYPDINTNLWIKREKYLIFYAKKNFLFLFRLIHQINNTPNDILYLNSFFDLAFSVIIMLSRWFGLLSAKNILIAPRGEFFDAAMSFKPLKKSVYLKLSKKLGFYNNVRWHASTEAESASIIKIINPDVSTISIAINLSKTDILHQTNYYSETEAYDSFQENPLRIIFLSRISKDKNVSFTFDVLMKVKAKVVFDVYGPIEDQYLWDICKEKIQNLPPNVSVNYLGYANRDDVKKIISKYDLFFLPTFAENYGHAIVESLSVGTTVLISDRTPWRNLKNDELGWDLSLDNPELFVEAIHDYAGWSHIKRMKKRELIKKSFNARLNNPEILNATRKLFN